MRSLTSVRLPPKEGRPPLKWGPSKVRKVSKGRTRLSFQLPHPVLHEELHPKLLKTQYLSQHQAQVQDQSSTLHSKKNEKTEKTSPHLAVACLPRDAVVTVLQVQMITHEVLRHLEEVSSALRALRGLEETVERRSCGNNILQHTTVSKCFNCFGSKQLYSRMRARYRKGTEIQYNSRTT